VAPDLDVPGAPDLHPSARQLWGPSSKSHGVKIFVVALVIEVRWILAPNCRSQNRRQPLARRGLYRMSVASTNCQANRLM